MQFTDSRNRTWRIARVAEIPFPTSVGGHSSDCPLEDVCKSAYDHRRDDVTSDDVLNDLKARLPEVKLCPYHQLTRDKLHYAAELSCWFVEQEVQPYPDKFEPVVKRDGYRVEVEHFVVALFDDPLHWTFQRDEQLTNGRHRLCAMKAKRIPRVAVEA